MIRTVLAFVVGAVIAAALVYYKIGRDTPAAEPTAQIVSPVTPAESPAAPAPEPPAPQAEPEKPAPMPPARTSPRERLVRETAAKPATKVSESSARENTQVAQNRPATLPPSAPVEAPPVSTPPPHTPPAASTQPNILPAPDRLEIKKPEPRTPQTVTIPAGTLLTVRVDQTLSSETNEAGDSFRATLDTPLVVDGFVIAERGARTQGRVVEVDRGGRVRGTATMTLELVSVTGSDGQRIRVETASFARLAERSRGRDAAKVGAAAGIGAAIGAIAGGGKGAAIGAGVGAAAGTGGVLATRGGAAEVPAETRISFKLAQPVTVTEKLQ